MERSQLENLSIIGIGAFMHLTGLSLSSALNCKTTILTPDFASLLVNVSLMTLLCHRRPSWNVVKKSSGPGRMGLLLVEMVFILYVVEIILVEVWLRLILLLNLFCESTIHDLLASNGAYLVDHAPQLAVWLSDAVFYIARFLLSFGIAYGIFYSQNCIPYFKEIVTKFMSLLNLNKR